MGERYSKEGGRSRWIRRKRMKRWVRGVVVGGGWRWVKGVVMGGGGGTKEMGSSGGGGSGGRW